MERGRGCKLLRYFLASENLGQWCDLKPVSIRMLSVFDVELMPLSRQIG